jgi:hypothetical protein
MADSAAPFTVTVPTELVATAPADALIADALAVVVPMLVAARTPVAALFALPFAVTKPVDVVADTPELAATAVPLEPTEPTETAAETPTTETLASTTIIPAAEIGDSDNALNPSITHHDFYGSDRGLDGQADGKASKPNIRGLAALLRHNGDQLVMKSFHPRGR